MTARHRFETKVQVGGKTATYFEIPLDVREVFSQARPPVRATINNHTYRSTVAVYGGRYFLPLNKTNREAAGVVAGDVIEVERQADEEVRAIDVPGDLALALEGSPEAKAAFDALSYSHRREHVDHIGEAKRPETRQRRIERALERLRAGKTQR